MTPRKFSLHSSCEGEHGIALESLHGNRASRCVEGGISKSFWSCSRKLWLPWKCDRDLRSFSECLWNVRNIVKLEGPLGTPLGSVQRKRASSRVEAGKTGLFLTCGGKLSVPLELGQVSIETSGVS